MSDELSRLASEAAAQWVNLDTGADPCARFNAALKVILATVDQVARRERERVLKPSRN